MQTVYVKSNALVYKKMLLEIVISLLILSFLLIYLVDIRITWRYLSPGMFSGIVLLVGLLILDSLYKVFISDKTPLKEKQYVLQDETLVVHEQDKEPLYFSVSSVLSYKITMLYNNLCSAIIYFTDGKKLILEDVENGKELLDRLSPN